MSTDDAQTHVLRNSVRKTKTPVRVNDYVMHAKVRYGIEKYVNYSCLNRNNMCFATMLNKSIDPTCYEEAIKDPNWVEAMNNEVEV